jgi:phosphoenolpyruvate synthase/pyruvate phosphate dikinase
MKTMHSYIFSLKDIDRTNIKQAGGKAANLGELFKVKGISVPDGFCISTAVFKKVIEETAPIRELLEQLSLLKLNERDAIREFSAKIRQAIEAINIPGDLQEEIARFLSMLGDNNAYAVRSSATAEDLPTASFAGQQDTYLNITGKQAVLQHVSKCWASLFTERAVIYRLQNGFDHRMVHLSVIIQKMIFPDAAGIMFTADPVNSNRKLLSIDASFGLGEALVAGIVNADNYKVLDGVIAGKKIQAKKLAVYASNNGGTTQQAIGPQQQNSQALTDEQVLRLAHLGRKVEKHFGSPQDIEWCLANDAFYIVQSRPITTLFPLPEVNDQENHVYISVGHQQMMTDAMKPLGLSLFQLTARDMRKAGGRLFVDITADLASPARREVIVNVLGKSDPIIRSALTTVLERENFIKFLPPDNNPADKKIQGADTTGENAPRRDFQTQLEYDPAIVPELIKRSETSLQTLKQAIQTKSGLDLIDFILEDLSQFKKSLMDSKSFGVIMTSMNALSWLNEKMYEWLGEKNAGDTLAQSVPDNITSEMGLALLDVADAVRLYPEIVFFLEHVKDDNFLDELPAIKGGTQTRDAIYNFLGKYGMRCAGEIDITRTRWSEKPILLVPIILNHIKNFEPGDSKRRFELGLQQALKKKQELLERVSQLPGAEQKLIETKQKIELIRGFAGYREYPKYAIINRYFVYKQALLKEAERLVGTDIIHETDDIYYLSFEELRELVQKGRPANNWEGQLISKRKEEFKVYQKLMPPRVFTSDGEIITGRYNRKDIPDQAIAGLAVSAGIIEGRARVILNMEDADIAEGDILVTTFTDPGWTALFVSIKGLVTEVGGLMTHGAVIAREYGLPAVVGVENATRLIKDGQKIRVNGTEGYVEIL